MRILLLCHGFNSLTQRLHVELAARGHELSVEFDINDRVTEEAVELWQPELLIAPFLKRAIPASVWRKRRCLVVHPGIVGDRGPSSLDWAVQEGEREWGVTVIEAVEEMDAGPVWATRVFPMREATKGSLYRREVTEAAVEAVIEAIGRVGESEFVPTLPDRGDPGVRGRARRPMRRSDRAIDWSGDDTATILRRIRAADGSPGVPDSIFGMEVRLFDAHAESSIRGGAPGEVIARRDGAILRATIDGALWIGHLMPSGGDTPIKLPASLALAELIRDVPNSPAPLWSDGTLETWREIRYEERGAVGVLHFNFYNGAMSTGQCLRLAEAIGFAAGRPTRVLLLMGGEDFWSNGIHLNVIEASDAPAEESWANINAIDDVALEILRCPQITVAALQANAGAGGVFLALAADRVLARRSVVLNPHYRNMGNLYGSEYWTYLLPRRLGAEGAKALMRSRLPIGALRSAEIGLIDCAVGLDPAGFRAWALEDARALAQSRDFDSRLAARQERRRADEAKKPLASYRAEELERIKLSFCGFDPSYHIARYNFVAKVAKSRTPDYLARHRDRG